LRLIFAAFLLSALAWLLGRFLAGSLLMQLTRLADSVQLDQAPELTARMDKEVAVLAEAIAKFRTDKQQHLLREREFSANVSHELRTPLTRIRTTAELLAETAHLSPPHQQRCEKIIQSVDDLEQKLQALLFLARDIQPVSARYISLHKALENAVERLPESHAQLMWHNHIAGDYSVNADPALLDLLLDNLLGNAWRYTPTGSVSATLNGDELMIADTGCGIAADALPHIFTPYQRASDIAGGQGLGLAIVARICDVYGWTCRIESSQDAQMHGSQVFLNFNPSTN
jgi:signal transduction histidine kinase